jgi:hypothetical protein
MGNKTKILVLLNADKKAAANFSLPSGSWTILADANQANAGGHGTIEKVAVVPELSGLILAQ